MGMYVEEIGGWVDKYIFKPICRICWYIMVAVGIIVILSIPIAAIKYLLKGWGGLL